MKDVGLLIEEIIKIRESIPLSWHEVADELGISYPSVYRLIDLDNKAPLRPLTIRKMKAMINRYKESYE
jgi:predicted DNA-binding transcriptional regulator AlpA